MESLLEQKIKILLTGPIADQGYHLVAVELKGRGDDLTLQIFIERADGSTVTIDDCTNVSRHISAILDVEDLFPGHYTLEVSSLGIDRLLFERADYEYYLGFDVRIDFKQRIDGRRHFKGKMVRIEGDILTLQNQEGEKCEVAFDNIKKARLILTNELLNFAQNKNPVKH